MDSITTIKDSRIKVKASKTLIDLLEQNKIHLNEVPENISKFLLKQSIQLSSKVEILKETNTQKTPAINVNLLRELLKEDISDNTPKSKEDKTTNKSKTTKTNDVLHLHLSDLRWLSNLLSTLRKEQGLDIYLNDVLETCQLELPQNEIIKRNPELEARCQRLREEQQNLEYRKMTKNVDAVLKHYPEDTVAYQIKAINSQIIAVLQFIFSVAAGFAFGFLGINLIIGNMEFGLRLLLGIMCALIIALAEIYFLAKKLNEYDNTVDTVNKAMKKTLPANKKIHAD
ncbi:transmembrane protein 199 [Lucilia sericata]|uniref:transmembrane protein 199 n=1 Tax=Lucilia sericata TaxID=13632 RepID=UPI0018A80BE5|nr:transmembrane protein 199 [Lucilia sericata]